MAQFDFGRDFQREVERAVQGAIKDAAAEYQKMFDALLRTHSGRSVSEIKPVLRRNWQRLGGDITDPELTQYAQHISNGTSIKTRTR
jgi:hypothetical protein